METAIQRVARCTAGSTTELQLVRRDPEVTQRMQRMQEKTSNWQPTIRATHPQTSAKQKTNHPDLFTHTLQRNDIYGRTTLSTKPNEAPGSNGQQKVTFIFHTLSCRCKNVPITVHLCPFLITWLFSPFHMLFFLFESRCDFFFPSYLGRYPFFHPLLLSAFFLQTMDEVC